MGGLLTPLDLTIFFGSLLAVMAIGLWAGWREETASDYYLAGRDARWWGVAASIFGSNVSANHIVGMMGLGFTAGFVQSHFEITAIAGLLMLCYAFLPMYRKLNIYTLSQYLSDRYNDSCRVAYAIIMLVIIVVIQMVPGFYIGSRSLNILLKQGRTAAARGIVKDGEIVSVEIVDGGEGYVEQPTVKTPKVEHPIMKGDPHAVLAAVVENGKVTAINIVSGGEYYQGDNVVLSINGGASFNPKLSPGDVDPRWYQLGIVLMAVVTGTYTILGGMKAVIITDVIQSVLMLIAGFVLAIFTFSQPEVGGWFGMMELDAAGARKMHLYKSTADPDFPWTGVMSGLMVLHFYYWGTNQFIVQRALAARSDWEAKIGIIAAGFFKLLIPFFSIAGGVAAYYLFQKQAVDVAQDAVFITLLTQLVAPVGFGLVGLVAAGLVGAILSSLDSMMNSAATIVTFDVYQRYVDPKASERKLIWVGRVCIAVFVVGSALLTILTMDPNSEASFFLQIATHQSKVVAGVVVAFIIGMLWRRATAAGAIASIVLGVVVSYGLPPLYAIAAARSPALVGMFGEKLNFMHSVFVAACVAAVGHIAVSLATKSDPKKSELTWDAQGVISNAVIRRFVIGIALSLALFAVLAVLVWQQILPPVVAALAAALWTWGVVLITVLRTPRDDKPMAARALLADDRFWAGLLAATAVFMMYYFY